MRPSQMSHLILALAMATIFSAGCHSLPASSATTGSTTGFTVGGMVSGLSGTGLVLQDNGGDSLTITANGVFTFKTSITTGGAYAVSVLTQPSGPTQTCTVTAGTGSGTVTANVTSVSVTCVTSFTIGGTISGLSGTGLVLEDNGGDNLSVSAAGAFAFKTPLATGATYAVTVLTQPTNPAQTCTVTAGTGSGTATANVTSVIVVCTTTPVSATIGGTISGLSGTGLILQDNGGDSLTISANGPFTFKTAVTGTLAYAVTVLTQPIGPPQICSVANGSSTATGNVTNVTVTCVLSYTIGGAVTGVVGTGLVLQDNGADNLTITANGPFTFHSPVPTGSMYAVTIFTQPTGPAQTCAVAAGTGTATANVTSVQITCAAVTYSIGGNVVGLSGGPVTDGSFQIQNNAGNNLTILNNGPFTFPTPVAINGAYDVSVFTLPSTQNQGCWVFNYQGVATGNVTNVVVDCGHNDWTWIDGNNTANQYGAYAATVVPPVNPYTNTPGGRDSGGSWVDSTNNLWLFGGQGYELTGKSPPDTFGLLNDLWVCPLAAGVDQCQWTLVTAPATNAETINVSGAYGTRGTAASSNLPGGRWGAVTWIDTSGNLWLFGGEGYDSVGKPGLLNDLWSYNPSTGFWTWVGGANTASQMGVYGTMGTPALANAPGARWAAVTWLDASGNAWLFGGQGYDSAGNVGLLSDLWEFTGGEWTWVGGSNLVNQNGIYGTLGTPAPANSPGGRQTAVSWTDTSGNLWLFGGEGNDSLGTANGVLNDLWEYNIVAKQWTFMAGSMLANQDGTYGTETTGPTNVAGTADVPGSRWGATAWTDKAGTLWLFGGWGLDATGNNGNGFLNDLWAYSTTTNEWSWVKGSTTGNQNGIYSPSLARPYAPYENWDPGGRRGATRWVDNNGELWLLGGQGYDSTGTTGNGYLNDLWRYLPYP